MFFSLRNNVFTLPGEKFFDENFGSRITESLFENIDEITKQINNNEGSLGLLINDKNLYNNLQKASKE